MKFITAILLTGLLGFAAGVLPVLPWWGFAISSLLVAILVHQKAGKAFLAGFIGLFLLWGGLAWWIDTENQGILSHKIAEVLPLGGNSYLLILLTAFVGGLVSGLAALCGSYARASRPR